MALTAIFVFFPFYVLWLDEKNNVVDIRRVKPFTPVIDTLKKSYTKILEIPINKRYKALIKDLVE